MIVCVVRPGALEPAIVGYSDYPPSTVRRCTKRSLISEKYATMNTPEVKVTPHEVTLKVIPHTSAPVRNPKTVGVTFHFCHVVSRRDEAEKAGRNLSKAMFLIAAINIQSGFQRPKTVPYRK